MHHSYDVKVLFTIVPVDQAIIITNTDWNRHRTPQKDIHVHTPYQYIIGVLF